MDGEKDRDREGSDTSVGQLRRPSYNRLDTGSDSQVSDHNSHSSHSQNHNNHHQQQHQQSQRPKHQKRIVGGGAGRFHARVPSTKALHKPQPPPMLAQTHRRATSDLRLTTVSNVPEPSTNNNNNTTTPSTSTSNLNNNLKKNTSHPNLATKRNRSHVDVNKRPKSTANIKRSSSHKDVQKLKGPKSQVHFDLGNDNDEDGNDDEWVDASTSASPYLSRRGSVVSGGQQSNNENENGSQSPTPHTDHRHSSPLQQTVPQSNYITSRLLQRTPSYGAPPQMSNETVHVPPQSISSTLQTSHGQPTHFGSTPKPATIGTLGASGPEELVSRFVNVSGNNSGGSYFVPTHHPQVLTQAQMQAQARQSDTVRRLQSLGNLNEASRDSVSGNEDPSVLKPSMRKSLQNARLVSESRTQQKLNLQRASTTIESSQIGSGAGAAGASLFVNNIEYEHRDSRHGKILERTGWEYLAVRRYQNPIARSIARLMHPPGTDKNKRMSLHNGANGNARGKDTVDLTAPGRLGSSRSMADVTRYRPTPPRRTASIMTTDTSRRSVRTVGGRSSFDGDEERLHEDISGSTSYGNDDEVTALLRNLWQKSSDLGVNHD